MPLNPREARALKGILGLADQLHTTKLGLGKRRSDRDTQERELLDGPEPVGEPKEGRAPEAAQGEKCLDCGEKHEPGMCPLERALEPDADERG